MRLRPNISSRFHPFVGLGCVIAALAWALVAAGCLKPDNDRSCGAGEPSCYKGERCVRGTCYEEQNAPAADGGADASSDGTSDTDFSEASDSSVAEGDGSDTVQPGDDADAVDCNTARASAKLNECCRESTDCKRGSCMEGICAHVVGVTNETYSGKLNGLDGADGKCASNSKKSGIPNGNEEGEWRAILSTDEYEEVWAKNRIQFEAPVYTVDGRLVAERGDTFWESTDSEAPRKKVNVTLDGTSVEEDVARVWTGTGTQGQGVDGNGAPYPNCERWTAQSGGNGQTGNPTATNINWIFESEVGCDQPARLYCVNGQ